MEQKIIDNAAVILLFIPAVSALLKLIVSFNMFDFVYLVLVGIIFLKCYIKTRKQK